MRAAIYVRVSSREQGKDGKTSLESQRDACHKLARSLGAEPIDPPYTDTDSGAKEGLPGILGLIDDAKRGAFDLVIMDHPDRFSRNLTRKVLLKAELEKTKVPIRYVSLVVEDTAEGRFTENIFAALAEYDRERIAFRNARGRRAKAARGMVVGNGWAPYGYDYTRDTDGRVVGLEPNEHALIVRRIFELIPTMSTQRVVNTLNREFVPSYHGGRWTDSTLAGILANPVYRGEWAYGRRDTDKRPTDSDTWTLVPCPPIVSRETWEIAQSALRARKTRRSARMAQDPYLLRGRLTCGYCGATLACTPNNRRRYYTCLRSVPSYARRRGIAQCLLPPLPAEPVEQHLWQLMQRTVLNPRWMREVYTDRARSSQREATARHQEARAIERQLDRLRGQLVQAMERVVNFGPGSARQKAAESVAEKLEASITELQERLDSLGSAPVETATVETPQQFSAEMLEALAAVSHDDQRDGIEIMAVTGAVHDDPEGERLGRNHRWRIAWKTGDVLLSDTRVYKKTRVSFYTGVYDEWERKYMPERVETA